MAGNKVEDSNDPVGASLIEGDLVAHWGFVYDMDGDTGGYVSGELLLRSNGVLLRRYGTSSYSQGRTSWEYGAWTRVGWWNGETNRAKAVDVLKGRGYGLCQPSPVPIDELIAGPFPGFPGPAIYI